MESTLTREHLCKAVAIRPRLLSLRETVVLAGVAEKLKCVRNDITHGVLPSLLLMHATESRLGFNLPYVLTFAAVYGNHFLNEGTDLRRIALEKVFFAAGGALSPSSTTCNSILFERSALCSYLNACSGANIAIDSYISINLAKACNDIRPRVDIYTNGLARVEERENILGGAAVFQDTRLSVVHVGKMVARGVPTEEILEDYPSLTVNDLEFARLYFSARPPVGRPNKGNEDVEFCARR